MPPGVLAKKLKQTASGHQVLCITHTPQIAAFADNQLLIEKKVRDNRTFTEIHPLDLDGRVQVLRPHDLQAIKLQTSALPRPRAD